MTKFTHELFVEYAQLIGLSPNDDGRYNKHWVVFACYIAHRHGFDAQEYLDKQNRKSFYTGMQTLKFLKNLDLADFLGATEEEIQECAASMPFSTVS